MADPARPTWVFDTSALIQLRSEVSTQDRLMVETELGRLVAEGRLLLVSQSISELRRYQGKDNPARTWAEQHEAAATGRRPSLETVKEVLSQVPEVIDADKDGEEEADPYILALALELKREGADVRVVTNEFKTTGPKMPLGSAAGFLAVPAVTLRTMLKFEAILEY